MKLLTTLLTRRSYRSQRIESAKIKFLPFNIETLTKSNLESYGKWINIHLDSYLVGFYMLVSMKRPVMADSKL